MVWSRSLELRAGVVWYGVVWCGTVRWEAYLVYGGARNRFREPWQSKKMGRGERGTDSVDVVRDKDRFASWCRRVTNINIR